MFCWTVQRTLDAGVFWAAMGSLAARDASRCPCVAKDVAHLREGAVAEVTTPCAGGGARRRSQKNSRRAPGSRKSGGEFRGIDNGAVSYHAGVTFPLDRGKLPRVSIRGVVLREMRHTLCRCWDRSIESRPEAIGIALRLLIGDGASRWKDASPAVSSGVLWGLGSPPFGSLSFPPTSETASLPCRSAASNGDVAGGAGGGAVGGAINGALQAAQLAQLSAVLLTHKWTSHLVV